MFDANMRGLPEDCVFYAQMNTVSPGCPLYEFSQGNDIILCEMVSSSEEDTIVRFFLPGSTVILSDLGTGLTDWFSYAGQEDGSDFINPKFREIAIENYSR
jgi:hypothetical protein